MIDEQYDRFVSFRAACSRVDADALAVASMIGRQEGGEETEVRPREWLSMDGGKTIVGDKLLREIFKDVAKNNHVFIAEEYF